MNLQMEGYFRKKANILRLSSSPFSGSDLILMIPFEQMIEIAKQKGSSPISMKRPYLPIQLNQNFHPLNY